MTLEELEIVVKANIDNATKKFEALKAQMDNIGGSDEVQENLKNISTQSEKMGDKIGDVDKEFSLLESTGAGALEALGKHFKMTKGESQEFATALAQMGTELGSVLAVVGTVAIVLVALAIVIAGYIASAIAIVKIIKFALTPRHESIV